MCTEWEDREQGQRGADIWHAFRTSSRFRAPKIHKGLARLASVLLPLTFLSVFLFACPLYNPAAFIQHETAPAGQNQTGPDDVLSTAAQITLEWDPPSTGASSVASYAVSYRVHGASSWTVLATVPASSQPSYSVLHSAIGDGSYDFAVAAVDSTGTSSPLHTSLDPTADPTTGWYLTWGQ